MPERLDLVQILLPGGVVVLPFDSRNELLAHLQGIDGGTHAIRAFKAAGASSAVVLKRKDKLLLVEMITGWARDVLVDGLPEGIWELRNALFNDLHDAPT